MKSHWDICLSVTLAFLLTPSCLAAESDAKVPALPSKGQFHLFMLAGQSNMAGRGKVTAADRKPIPRVFMLNKQNQWVPAVAPLHFDKSVAGSGIGRPFAATIAEHNPSIAVGLIPCAVGGSPISSWDPGGFHSQTKSHPYDDAVARVKIAMQHGTLKGILWHQGESDSGADRADLYAAKLQALVARFRAEFQSPDLPFIVGQLGQFPDNPWSDGKKKVDAAHRSLPEKVHNTAFVSSTGLTHRGDKVHFNRESLIEFGHRYATAYLTLVSTGTKGSPAAAAMANVPGIDPHLAGWWKLDETSGTVSADASGQGHQGTLKGGLAFASGSIAGRHGRALQFDGKDDLVEIRGYKGVTGTQPRTIAAWIKTKTTRGDLVSWGEDDAGKMWMMRFIRGHVGVTPSGGYLYMKERINDDKWHHVAAVITGGDPPDLDTYTKIYLDGDSTTIDDIGRLNLWPIETGSDQNVQIGNGFEGALDDIRIYDRALSEEEIKALYAEK